MSAVEARNAEIKAERSELERVHCELELGRNRLQSQRQLVAHLREQGRDVTQAERLAGLLDQTLEQWELHRSLIEQRIAYLERLNADPVLRT